MCRVQLPSKARQTVCRTTLCPGTLRVSLLTMLLSIKSGVLCLILSICKLDFVSLSLVLDSIF